MNLRQDRNNSRRVWAAVLLLSVPVMALASKEDISLAFTPDHILAYITATLLIGVFVMLFLNLIYLFREEDVKNDSTSQNNRLALVLQTGYLRLWFYIPATRHYIILSETGSYTNEYNPIDFSHFFERDDHETMRTAIFDVCEDTRCQGGRRNPEDFRHQCHRESPLEGRSSGATTLYSARRDP